MKVFLMILALLFGNNTINAEEPSMSYLTIETKDGIKASVPLHSQSISFIGTTLITKEQSFELSNVKKIYFSDTDETSNIAIQPLVQPIQLDFLDIYDLNGYKIAKEKMRKGLYIVKGKEGSYKMIVK